IDIMGLQAAYANLHTDQERDYFMQRYHDVISSFGGKTSYDADNRPLLVMRSNLWASGYDVDGSENAALGQCSGRVQQTYKHSVPRFFVPEHGTMFTLALVRFPPTATKEIQYLNAKGMTKNVITSCSVTMMLFLHLEVKPLMTLTTVLYLSCALISGHLAMMLMELTKRR